MNEYLPYDQLWQVAETMYSMLRDQYPDANDLCEIVTTWGDPAMVGSMNVDTLRALSIFEDLLTDQHTLDMEQDEPAEEQNESNTQ